MTRNTLATLCVAIILLASVVANAYQVTPSHPRLYFTSSELSTLRSKCSGALSSDYQRMKSWCDSHLNDSLPLASPDFYETYLAAYSFTYLMSFFNFFWGERLN